MEKKAKYRILGVLIVVGLIIILLPLFLSEKEDQAPDVAIIKTPPFPDQVVQVNGDHDAFNQTAPFDLTKADETSIETDSNLNTNKPQAVNKPQATVPDSSVSNPAEPSHSDSQANASPLNVVNNDNKSLSPKPSNDAESKQAKTVANSENTNLTNQPNANETNANIPDKQMQPKLEDKAKSAKLNEDEQKEPTDRILTNQAHADNAKHQTQNHARPKNLTQKLTHAALTHEPLNKNGLLDLKNPSWVIQVGSFKNKTNAVRIVNRLRAKGFPAFIQHVTNSAFGETIRVFVGPEDKQTDANALAKRMEADLHVAGIVISYKPLAL